MNGTSEVEKAEEVVSKIMFLLNAPAQRMATALKRALTVGFFEVACAGKGCTAKLRLPKGVKLSADSRYTCKECCGDRSILDTPTSEIERVLEGKLPSQKRQFYNLLGSARRARGYSVDYADGTSGYREEVYDQHRSEAGKETSRRWRNNHKEEAAEYKRAKRAGVSYVESRKELMSDAAWEANLKEFDYACSDCRQPLTLRTANRSAEGPTYVPVCDSCLGKKAAEVRWKKEKKLEKQ